MIKVFFPGRIYYQWLLRLLFGHPRQIFAGLVRHRQIFTGLLVSASAPWFSSHKITGLFTVIKQAFYAAKANETYSASQELNATHPCSLDAQETTNSERLCLKRKPEIDLRSSVSVTQSESKKPKSSRFSEKYTQEIETRCPWENGEGVSMYTNGLYQDLTRIVLNSRQQSKHRCD